MLRAAQVPNSYRVRSLRASQGRRRDRRDQSDYSPGRVHPYRRTCMPFHRGRAVRRDFRRPATIIAPRTVPHHRIPNCLVGGLLTQRHFNCGEVVPSRVEGAHPQNFYSLPDVSGSCSMGQSTAAVRSIPVLRNNHFKPEFASLPEQVRTDLALFECRRHDAPACARGWSCACAAANSGCPRRRR